MEINLNSNMMGGLKTKRQKFGIGSLIGMLLFGVIFAGGGIFALTSNNVDSSWTRVSGKVVRSSSSTSDGSTTYTPVVEYSADGKSYEVTGSIGTSSHPSIGSSREVAYNPEHPDQGKVIESAGAMWFVYLFPIIGILTILYAPYQFIRSRKRDAAINNLVQTGQKSQGVLVDIQNQNTSNNSTNSTNTYRIVVAATGPDGTVQNCVSDPLTGIGGLAMANFRNTPIPIDVYFNPTNPQEYYVDVSDIPNLTPERIGELLKSTVSKQPDSTVTGEKPPMPPIPPIGPMPPTAS